ncbi:hypothetical protein ACJX0J_027787, partial [Zea mays]
VHSGSIAASVVLNRDSVVLDSNLHQRLENESSGLAFELKSKSFIYASLKPLHNNNNNNNNIFSSLHLSTYYNNYHANLKKVNGTSSSLRGFILRVFFMLLGYI